MSAWEEYKARNGVTPLDLLKLNSQEIPLDEVAKRYAMCTECPYFQKITKQCLKCGCFMLAKTKLDQAKCPMGKWGEYVPDAE